MAVRTRVQQIEKQLGVNEPIVYSTTLWVDKDLTFEESIESEELSPDCRNGWLNVFKGSATMEGKFLGKTTYAAYPKVIPKLKKIYNEQQGKLKKDHNSGARILFINLKED